jgi:hypothetical protein
MVRTGWAAATDRAPVTVRNVQLTTLNNDSCAEAIASVQGTVYGDGRIYELSGVGREPSVWLTNAST